MGIRTVKYFLLMCECPLSISSFTPMIRVWTLGSEIQRNAT